MPAARSGQGRRAWALVGESQPGRVPPYHDTRRSGQAGTVAGQWGRAAATVWLVSQVQKFPQAKLCAVCVGPFSAMDLRYEYGFSVGAASGRLAGSDRISWCSRWPPRRPASRSQQSPGPVLHGTSPLGSDALVDGSSDGRQDLTCDDGWPCNAPGVDRCGGRSWYGGQSFHHAWLPRVIVSHEMLVTPPFALCIREAAFENRNGRRQSRHVSDVGDGVRARQTRFRRPPLRSAPTSSSSDH